MTSNNLSRPSNDRTAIYHRALARFGVVFMETEPGEKRTKYGWDYYDRLHRERGKSRIDKLAQWIREGGAMYRPGGRLWVLDCDDQATVHHVEAWLVHHNLACPQVSTPSGGRHFIFRLPESLDLEGLKNHVCLAGGKKWDFKLGGRTALVLVGTIVAKGSYLPHTPWVEPPEVDPRDLEPSIELFKPTTPFLTYPRLGGPARFAAKAYLRNSITSPAVAGEGGRKTLATVACNLLRFYCLEPHNALTMLLRDDPDRMNWNQRCRYQDGSLYPWTQEELWDALMESQDAIPSLGRKRWREEKFRAEVREKLSEYAQGVRNQVVEAKEGRGGRYWASTASLYWDFLNQNGWDRGQASGRPIDLKRFSQALKGAGLEIGRKGGRSAVLNSISSTTPRPTAPN